jgi:periplasmic chaperone LolA
MRRTTILITLLLAALSLQAAELDRVAATLPGSQAQFAQRFTPKGFRTSQIESGSVLFGALPQMRWTYNRPEEKLFLFDGARSWFYVPAEKQATVTALDDAKRSELPFLVLGDPAARDRNFVLRESRQGRSIVTTLQPRSTAATIRSIAVSTDPVTHLLQRVEYKDRDGNQTAFEFSSFQKINAPADSFHFMPPAGVHVVQQ